MKRLALALLSCSILSFSVATIQAQEKSVRPGVNDTFRDPNVGEFVEKFEIESREVFSKRDTILKSLSLSKGMVVADIGAGTGLFTRLFSDAVGKEGQVLAVDIAQNFLDHIQKTCRETSRANVQTILCTADSTALPANSVDVAYICDTYHHFEFPIKTMTSLHAALKPGGRVYMIDFHRIEGKSTDWTLKHVRDGQEVFEKEILSCGFKKTREFSDLLKDNYFLEFTKVSP
ncbi:MAG: methyltransferase domain-containing protein [Pirellulales bacterium]